MYLCRKKSNLVIVGIKIMTNNSITRASIPLTFIISPLSLNGIAQHEKWMEVKEKSNKKWPWAKVGAILEESLSSESA